MATAKARTMEIGRDVKTGKFIPVKLAKRRKATAAIETLKFKKAK